jgi:Zn-dependent M16 (insulinase) family peptidase
VNFVAESFLTVPYDHPDCAKLTVLSELLSLNFLHKEVRENGGAYGAGISNDSTKGTFSLYSYRDPNHLKTYTLFEKCINQVSNGEFDQRQIDEAKLSAFGKIDHPKVPQNRGLGEFLNGVDWDMRQNYRERVLGAERADLIETVGKYLLEPLKATKTSRIIFGIEDINEEMLKREGWRVQKPIEE